jgi:hypothetical protein
VIRVEDGSKKANIGIGFLERSQSFDFSVSSLLHPDRTPPLIIF